MGGTTIHIHAPSRSETSLDNYAAGFDYRVQNDPGQDVFTQVRDIAVRETILWGEAFRREPLTVFVDLDDTLLSTLPHYREAENRYFREVVDPLFTAYRAALPVERAHEAVCKLREHARHFSMLAERGRYAPVYQRSSLATAMAEALSVWWDCDELTDAQYRAARDRALEIGFSVHDCEFPAFEGGVEALLELDRHANVVVYTVGERPDQVRKALRAGLFGIPVEVVPAKNPTVLAALMNKYPSIDYALVGDNARADIAPAVELEERGEFPAVGFMFYVQPSGEPYPHPGVHTVRTFAEAAEILCRIAQEKRKSRIPHPSAS